MEKMRIKASFCEKNGAEGVREPEELLTFGEHHVK